MGSCQPSSVQKENVIATYPNLSVHMPIIPQSGIRIVTTLVTTNYGNDQDCYNHRIEVEQTIFFVLIFQ